MISRHLQYSNTEVLNSNCCMGALSTMWWLRVAFKIVKNTCGWLQCSEQLNKLNFECEFLMEFWVHLLIVFEWWNMSKKLWITFSLKIDVATEYKINLVISIFHWIRLTSGTGWAQFHLRLNLFNKIVN